ncbi:hypothetical protein HanXRQr2_Chr16g0752371 [Helianthus annuus]|uniref:Uncharacterized protein n=2 Tax=Helianthus annuus TaxID=4232 RepID=A0A9K3H0J7_HELAN|nr:hypothetical protein HanXRQr2_Chr16g0752371 [Helianthus annuus]KAJ0821517.1 hypothetical protein HanPSC8_Chr16g0721161 [Helianthus annuus]
MKGIGFSLFLYRFRRNKSRLFQRWSCSVDRGCCMMAMWLSPSSGSVFKQNVPPTEELSSIAGSSPMISRFMMSNICRDNYQRKTDGRRRHRRWSSAIMKVTTTAMDGERRAQLYNSRCGTRWVRWIEGTTERGLIWVEAFRIV